MSSTPQFPVCKGCRKYGIPLIDNFCEMCYTLGIGINVFRPGRLPNPVFDLHLQKLREDARTTLSGNNRTGDV